MSVDASFWRGKRVFLTGHTGFKGSWLSLWLQSLGAELHGFALSPPTDPSLFREARVAAGMAGTTGDIRDLAALQTAISAFRPDIVIHMAAQPLVRLSYAEPVETYATNVMGTVHLLEAVRQTHSVRVVVNVTTDKCYENKEWAWGYREDEPMGGYDPYSNSKGCAELVSSAYRQSFFQQGGPALATARAGNVIGGGDWASDRLVPDILRAFERSEPVVIRNPHSTRPWQHVLEPLAGYLVLAQHLWDGGASFAEGWNLGPRDEDARPVQWIVEQLVDQWGRGARWQLDGGAHPHEANYLKLDISKARARLGWQPSWRLADALQHIVTWHQAWLAKQDVRALCLQQIAQYTNDSKTIAS
ncbi:CDP-glucose 4,6-dehydratase [Ideonella azotifigens]|uniref:CDP-glucose 4,6-dehydratase n=1 Tax=Ideonella azotifigens TaxID=513160 RepID=A0ABN1K0P0_9BURK|nr:CDP-glucose 4,6-dehydratase [Ideonella azotifigens]MCD2341577.1 CDP-glucose 4,6-dehydratase [Ideonella azotifigens]